MRFRLTDLTASRIVAAARRRVEDIPHRLAWAVSAFAAENRRRLDRYRDAYRGRRCFVMANGPSLARTDVSRLRSETTLSMNRAYLLYREWGFEPTFYVCINELVLEQFADDIGRLRMPRFLNYNRRELFPNAVGDLDLLFLRLGLGIRDRFVGDAGRTLSSGGTVTFACLQLAYFMGFQEVVLIGLDHRFEEKGVPNATEVRTADRDSSHCHPDYFPKGIKWQLPDLYRSELAYALARQAFERDGRRIVDATLDGHCEVFPKVRFADVL